MKRLWLVLLILLPLGVAVSFLPLRRIAWRLTAEEGEKHYDRWLVWFMSRQRPDGDWNEGPASLEGHPIGRTGQTGLALLTFLGAGYSHYSKDRYEWYDAGPCVKRGVQFLMNDQLPDGSFRSSAGMLDHTLTTLALTEAYGLTGSNLFQKQAQAATDALVRRVRDGELRDDPSLHAWATMALWSAEISGLPFDREAHARIRAFYDSRTAPADAGEILARIAIDKKKDHPRLAPGASALAARPIGPGPQEFADWYWTSSALFNYDGASGPVWNGWQASLRSNLLPRRTSRGEWPGRTRGETFVQTCQATLTLMVYYRYANVFGTNR